MRTTFLRLCAAPGGDLRRDFAIPARLTPGNRTRPRWTTEEAVRDLLPERELRKARTPCRIRTGDLLAENQAS